MPIYPIGFSIHPTKIVGEVPEKTKLVASLIPGNTATYIYHTEKDYYDDYKRSFFAITHKKGGWDCMRHYEILACGCIPLFTDLEECPPDIMTLFPKDIILQTNKIYKEIVEKGGDSVDLAHQLCLKEIYIRPLLDYTRKYLTNDKLARYILEKSVPLLGKFRFMEIPTSEFKGPIEYKEILTDKPPEREQGIATEFYLDRPPVPLFIPRMP
jgi:hypothetical protein